MEKQTISDYFSGFESTVQNVDFLIVGQGICGTFLSYYLLMAGKKVMVIDDNQPYAASKVASGVINPVTGRRIVRTWMIEELLPFALNAYKAIGDELGVKLINECRLFDFHPTHQMKEAFDKRLIEEREYLHQSSENKWKRLFNFHFGVGEINPCLHIDMNTLLIFWRKKLQQQNKLIEGVFSYENLTVNDDFIRYDNFNASKIIFCDGVQGINNQYFKNLPFSPNKGEAIIVKIPTLDTANIYKHGVSIVPWKEDLFWVGSTYEWNFSDPLPTPAFKEKIGAFLNYFLKIPFEIVDQFASIRPATMERRPFVGLHPIVPGVGILNGMGTKGCSLAPFFAKQLADLLTEAKPISPEADVKRFEKTLARKMD